MYNRQQHVELNKHILDVSLTAQRRYSHLFLNECMIVFVSLCVFNIDLHLCCFFALVLYCLGGCLLCMLCFLHVLSPFF